MGRGREGADDRGTVWLKEPRGATAFEVPLYELLAARVPDLILVPVAVDVRRGWVLLPEGGEPLGEETESAELGDTLADALARYARLQRALAGDVDQHARTRRRGHAPHR